LYFVQDLHIMEWDGPEFERGKQDDVYGRRGG